VAAKTPEIAVARNGLRGWFRRWCIGIALRWRVTIGADAGQQILQRFGGKAKHVQIYRSIVADARNLRRQQRLVPAGIQRDLIIREPQRSRLGFGQMRQSNGGDRCHAEPLCGHHAAVARDQYARAIHKHRVHTAKLGY
jgi:hypothetical protein